MALKGWKKVENEAGYPCYVEETTNRQEYDHPEFRSMIESLKEYDQIKYSAYRIAFKIYGLQSKLKVPPLRISLGAFAKHQLSLSESSLSLDMSELEAVLGDIYFAAEKEGLFVGDVDLAVDLLINLLFNVYDKDRKTPIRVLAAKILLILLSEESVHKKWSALANCCVDHDGCMSPNRLGALLMHVSALSKYLGSFSDQIQADVDSCFDKNAGMLSVSARSVTEWGARNCVTTQWLGVALRVLGARATPAPSVGAVKCAACTQSLVRVLKFKCSKCNNTYLCENCYLYNKDLTSVSEHKKTHLVLEIFDEEMKRSKCPGIIKGLKRFFFCTKTKKKMMHKNGSKKSHNTVENHNMGRKNGKPTIYTSTVGKASGNNANNPASTLQDIIQQLETQNKALQELSSQLHNAGSSDEQLKAKADGHYNQISVEIDRLKILKENLASSAVNLPAEVLKLDKNGRIQIFDIFSPIPVDKKQSKVIKELKSQPREPSMVSRTFLVVSKQVDSQNLLTMSGDALKPVVVHTKSDTISMVSMNDISSWYNETESVSHEKRCRQSASEPQADVASQSISATGRRFAADIPSVETSKDEMRELDADLDAVLDRLQQTVTHNFIVHESCFDNTRLRETANELERLLGTPIRGVKQRATLNANKGLV